MKNFVQAGVAGLALALAVPAQAADLEVAPVYRVAPVPWVPSWFVEGRVGAALGSFDDFLFLNPTGALLTRNSGSFDVLLTGKSVSDTAFTGGVTLGAFLTGALFVKASYQYLGSFHASGLAPLAGPATPSISQELTARASALLFGVGADFHITEALFVEATGDVGVGFLHSTGTQGAGAFPVEYLPTDHTNMVAAGGLGAGYYFTRNFGVLLNGNFYYLGRADTGITGNPPLGMNPGEQLQAKLRVFTLTLAGRARF